MIFFFWKKNLYNLCSHYLNFLRIPILISVIERFRHIVTFSVIPNSYQNTSWITENHFHAPLKSIWLCFIAFHIKENIATLSGANEKRIETILNAPSSKHTFLMFHRLFEQIIFLVVFLRLDWNTCQNVWQSNVDSLKHSIEWHLSETSEQREIGKKQKAISWTDIMVKVADDQATKRLDLEHNRPLEQRQWPHFCSCWFSLHFAQ